MSESAHFLYLTGAVDRNPREWFRQCVCGFFAVGKTMEEADVKLHEHIETDGDLSV